MDFNTNKSNLFSNLLDDYRSDFDNFQGVMENLETNIQQKEEYFHQNIEHHCRPYQDLLNVYEMQKFDEGMYLGSNVLEGKLNNCVHHHSNALISDLNEMKDKLKYFKDEENKISEECAGFRQDDIEGCVKEKCTRLKEEIVQMVDESSQIRSDYL